MLLALFVEHCQVVVLAENLVELRGAGGVGVGGDFLQQAADLVLAVDPSDRVVPPGADGADLVVFRLERDQLFCKSPS